MHARRSPGKPKGDGTCVAHPGTTRIPQVAGPTPNPSPGNAPLNKQDPWRGIDPLCAEAELARAYNLLNQGRLI